MKWRIEVGNCARFRELPGAMEVDFHWSESGREWRPYDEGMADVYDEALNELKCAQTFMFGVALSGGGYREKTERDGCC